MATGRIKRDRPRRLGSELWHYRPARGCVNECARTLYLLDAAGELRHLCNATTSTSLVLAPHLAANRTTSSGIHAVHGLPNTRRVAVGLAGEASHRLFAGE